VACPSICEYLPDPRVALHVALDVVQKEIVAEGLRKDAQAEAGIERFLGPTRQVHEWEREALVGWMAYGLVDRAGERAVDRVRLRREGAGASSPEEREALRALSEAAGSVYEVVEVRRDEGLLLRDLRSGEQVFVHERLATLQLRPGQVLLTWVMRLGDRHELLGMLTDVPAPHVRPVMTAFEAAQARLRAETPDVAPRLLAGAAMADAHRALRDAVRDYVPRGLDADGHELVACDATYELRDAAQVEACLVAHPDFVAAGPGRFAWLGEPAPGDLPWPDEATAARLVVAPESRDGATPPVFAMIRRGPGGGPPRRVLGDVELRTVRLTLSCGSVEQLAVGKALLARLLGERLRLRHERTKSMTELVPRARERAGGEGVPREALDPRDPTPLDVQVQRWLEAHPEALAELEDRGAREAASRADRELDLPVPGPSAPAPTSHRLRPLPHERMRELEPEAMSLAVRLAKAERLRPGWEDRTLTQQALMESGDLDDLLRDHALGLVAEGASRAEALGEATALAGHVHYAANHELHHRKTFWVDEALAWALLRTELDVPGACLRLPFPSTAFVFADRATLDLADSLLAGDEVGGVRGRPVRMLTVYVVRGEVAARGTDLRLAFLFDRSDEDEDADVWPYLLARDLVVRPEDRLDAILESHHDDLPPGGPDPVFLAPEMKKLVHLAINAVLYSTSRLLEPVSVGPPRRPGAPERRRKKGGLGKGSGPGHSSPKAYSDEDVYHLPGTIDISSLKRFQDLERSEGGRQVLRRFMVRGHWRRANATWTDQRLRWIEPYWKGPDMGMIIERDYRLMP